MPKHVLFTIKENADLILAEEELTHLGVENLYILEDPLTHQVQMGGYLPEEMTPFPKGVFYENIEIASSDIDWEKQWKSFGTTLVDLKDYGKEGIFELQAGEGFGDLSHPTTRLCLKLLSQHFQNLPIIDVGCGSGVLAIAAKTLGAKEVYAVDIDEKALEHTRENAEKNHIKDLYIGQNLPFNFQKETLVLLNLITSEQREAWGSINYQLNAPYFVIASGVLKEEQKSFEKEIKKRNWEVLSISEEEGWLAFYCKGEPYALSI